MSPLLFDTITDSDGDAVAVLVLGDFKDRQVVVLRSVERDTGHIQEVFLDASLRDRFIKAYAAAEMYAEAYDKPPAQPAPASEGEHMEDTEIPGQAEFVDGIAVPTETDEDAPAPLTEGGVALDPATPATEADEDDEADPADADPDDQD